MNQQSGKTLFLAKSALIAAAYAALTWLAALWGLAYGPVQFRFSEALTVLPAFASAAVPGLTLGCLLANVLSGYGVYDMIFGTLATFLAALLSRAVRNVRFRGISILAPLPPVVCNAVIVGLEITALSAGSVGISPPGSLDAALFWSNAASVGLGELVICYGLGVPLMVMIEKNQKLKSLLR